MLTYFGQYSHLYLSETSTRRSSSALVKLMAHPEKYFAKEGDLKLVNYRGTPKKTSYEQ